MPAAAVARRTPAISGISGTETGASGETVVDIVMLSSCGGENARPHFYGICKKKKWPNFRSAIRNA
jgi:hypothetical protein